MVNNVQYRLRHAHTNKRFFPAQSMRQYVTLEPQLSPASARSDQRSLSTLHPGGSTRAFAPTRVPSAHWIIGPLIPHGRPNKKNPTERELRIPCLFLTVGLLERVVMDGVYRQKER